MQVGREVISPPPPGGPHNTPRSSISVVLLLPTVLPVRLHDFPYLGWHRPNKAYWINDKEPDVDYNLDRRLPRPF